MAQQIQPINLHINIPPDINPEAASALGESIARFLAQFSGQGTAAANHRTRTASAPKAVSDAPVGDSTKELRTWVKEYEATHPGEQITVPKADGSMVPVPMTGQLSKAAREAIIAFRAEVAQAEGEDGGDEMIDAEVDEEPVEAAVVETPAAPEPRKGFRRKAQANA